MNLLTNYQRRIRSLLLTYLQTQKSPEPLQQAMEYCIGGKHIRALIIYTLGKDLNIPLTTLDSIAISIELMHSFTLIHDDLPCMDNDDFRRNKPSCHRKFNEAIAILTGDALQSLSFGALAETPDCSLDMIRALSYVAGPNGLNGGQTLDCTNTAQSAEDHLNIISMKTADLIAVCFTLTALIIKLDSHKINQLTQAGHNLGIAFQLQDDIQDYQQDSQSILQFLSLDATNKLIHSHFQQARTTIDKTLKNPKELTDLLDFIENRELA
jgi:farnesyl diphosphate synthase